MSKEITKSDWIKYFPYPEIRPQQETAINFILNAFASGKRYVIGEFSPGVGKSAIAVAVSNYLHNTSVERDSTYIVTTQKVLQEQYMRDFPQIASVMASTNYQCQSRLAGITCDMGLRMAYVLSKNKGDIASYFESCVYKRDKKKFDSSAIALTNLAYFLNHAGSDIAHRDLLIVDECHAIEDVVTSFAELKFNKYFVEEKLKIPFPVRYNTTIDEFIKWVRTVYLRKLDETFIGLDYKVRGMSSSSYLESNSGIKVMRKLEDYKRKMEKIDRGMKNFNSKEWVMTISPTTDVVSIKPIFADKYTNNMLFGYAKKVLMMSATILDKKTFCRNIGINPDKAEFMSLDSPFPIKNRPVFEVTVGSMGRKSIDATLPNMVSSIKELIEHHKNEKGIIHVHTYKIAKYISEQIDDDRLLFHSSDDRMDILNFHIQSKEPTILVSPSFTEGIDLSGELSRFQIIAKIPFPFMGDNYVKEKMSRVPQWYNWQTIKTIIQSSGRSVRNSDDWCITYILDSDFQFLYKRNEKLIPVWWKDSLVK